MATRRRDPSILLRQVVPAPARRAAAPLAMPVSPTATLSTTRAQGNSRGSWNMMRVRLWSVLPPPWSSVPEVGRSRPASRRKSVLLPQPLLPMIARNCPASKSKVDAVEHLLVAEALSYVLEGEGRGQGRFRSEPCDRRGIRRGVIVEPCGKRSDGHTAELLTPSGMQDATGARSARAALRNCRRACRAMHR